MSERGNFRGGRGGGGRGGRGGGGKHHDGKDEKKEKVNILDLTRYEKEPISTRCHPAKLYPS
jgi:U6 snRNA-associated Sm-like protein LSm7